MGHSAMAGDRLRAAGAGGRAAMGWGLVPGGLAVWAGLAARPPRLAAAAPR